MDYDVKIPLRMCRASKSEYCHTSAATFHMHERYHPLHWPPSLDMLPLAMIDTFHQVEILSITLTEERFGV
jgi:hypothetical protein